MDVYGYLGTGMPRILHLIIFFLDCPAPRCAQTKRDKTKYGNSNKKSDKKIQPRSKRSYHTNTKNVSCRFNAAHESPRKT